MRKLACLIVVVSCSNTDGMPPVSIPPDKPPPPLFDSGTDGTTPPIVCSNDCHYVSPDANGTADGSSWVNAMKDLSAQLLRGHTYFIGKGSFKAHDFKDPANGSVTCIVRA